MVAPNTMKSPVDSASGVMLALIDRIDSDGTPWLCVKGRHIPAIPTTSIDSEQILNANSEAATAVVALVENGQRAVILGFLAPYSATTHQETPEPAEVTVDGRRVAIEGQREIVLRCGKASITLTRAGKVLIRGAYVSSRSSGINVLKGGSVHVN